MADHKELEDIDEKARLNEESDNAKIKFQPSKNGEAKIDMPDSSSVGYQCGLTKDELMKYANDPFWVTMRRVLLVLFWMLWIGMLLGAVAIIFMTPGCDKPKEPEWYEKSPLYELRVDEFFDGDGDQKSDLAGIKEKLAYFDEISISAVVLDGLFNKDNPTIMDPTIGSFDTFQKLAENLKLVLRIPVSEMDLSSEQKQAEFVDVLKFWLGKDAAGFVFDGLELLPKTLDLKTLTGQWHNQISNFSTEDFPRVSILSSYKGLDEKEFCDNAQMVLNYKPIKLSKGFTPKELVELLEHTTVEKDNTTTSCRSNLVLSNGDIQPLLDRFDPAERDRLILFSLLADATPFIYFGDEYANSDPGMPTHLARNSVHTPHPMNWKTINGMKKEDKNFFRVFQKAAKIRHAEDAIQMGETSLKELGANVVGMSRIKKSSPGFAVVTNFGNDPEKVDLSQLDEHIPESGHVDIVSTNSDREKGKVALKDLQVGGHETIVLQFVAKF